MVLVINIYYVCVFNTHTPKKEGRRDMERGRERDSLDARKKKKGSK